MYIAVYQIGLLWPKIKNELVYYTYKQIPLIPMRRPSLDQVADIYLVISLPLLPLWHVCCIVDLIYNDLILDFNHDKLSIIHKRVNDYYSPLLYLWIIIILLVLVIATTECILRIIIYITKMALQDPAFDSHWG
jgi:hypothetical protein